MPARAPASIDMLHRVMRCFHVSARMALAAVFDDVAGAAVDADHADDVQDQVLGADAGRSAPSTVIASVFGRRCSRHCVASTWPTSLVPMPKASAPNAPCVAVWLSPQTMVMPGWVRPSSGADHVHDAALGRSHVEQLDAVFGAVARQRVDLGFRGLGV
jgi:hypothetical protein